MAEFSRLADPPAALVHTTIIFMYITLGLDTEALGMGRMRGKR